MSVLGLDLKVLDGFDFTVLEMYVKGLMSLQRFS